MNKILQFLSLLFVLAVPLTVFAESSDKGYIEAVVALPKYTETSGFSATPTVGLVRVGTNLSDNIAIEGLAGTTVINATDSTGHYIAKIDSMFGAYVKAKTSIGNDIQIFGRIGGVYLSGNAYISGAYQVASGTGFSYGGGAQYDFSAKTYVTIDYMSYYSALGVTVSGPSIGIGMKF
jgi:hypothetical protein